jgi:hypothetical protein
MSGAGEGLALGCALAGLLVGSTRPRTMLSAPVLCERVIFFSASWSRRSAAHSTLNLLSLMRMYPPLPLGPGSNIDASVNWPGSIVRPSIAKHDGEAAPCACDGPEAKHEGEAAPCACVGPFSVGLIMPARAGHTPLPVLLLVAVDAGEARLLFPLPPAMLWNRPRLRTVMLGDEIDRGPRCAPTLSGSMPDAPAPDMASDAGV